MARTRRYLGRPHQMKEKDDLNVRKVGQSPQAIRRKLQAIEINPRCHAAPDIVDRLAYMAADHRDRRQLNLADHSNIVRETVQCP